MGRSPINHLHEDLGLTRPRIHFKLEPSAELCLLMTKTALLKERSWFSVKLVLRHLETGEALAVLGAGEPNAATSILSLENEHEAFDLAEFAGAFHPAG